MRSTTARTTTRSTSRSERVGDADTARGMEARTSATLVHDLRGPLVTLDGFAGEIGEALGELETLLERGEAPEAIVAKLRELMVEDLRPCLGFVADAAAQLHERIDRLALPADAAPPTRR